MEKITINKKHISANNQLSNCLSNQKIKKIYNLHNIPDRKYQQQIASTKYWIASRYCSALCSSWTTNYDNYATLRKKRKSLQHRSFTSNRITRLEDGATFEMRLATQIINRSACNRSFSNQQHPLIDSHDFPSDYILFTCSYPSLQCTPPYHRGHLLHLPFSTYTHTHSFCKPIVAWISTSY